MNSKTRTNRELRLKAMLLRERERGAALAQRNLELVYEMKALSRSAYFACRLLARLEGTDDDDDAEPSAETLLLHAREELEEVKETLASVTRDGALARRALELLSQCADLTDEQREDATQWRPILRPEFAGYFVDHSDVYSRLRNPSGDMVHSWLKPTYGNLNIFRTKGACEYFIHFNDLSEWFEPAAFVGLMWSHVDWCFDEAHSDAVSDKPVTWFGPMHGNPSPIKEEP